MRARTGLVTILCPYMSASSAIASMMMSENPVFYLGLVHPVQSRPPKYVKVQITTTIQIRNLRNLGVKKVDVPCNIDMS